MFSKFFPNFNIFYVPCYVKQEKWLHIAKKFLKSFSVTPKCSRFSLREKKRCCFVVFGHTMAVWHSD